MGLGYEDIDKIAPHIVYCSITGYGQTGPLSQRAGYDAVASAVSGLMHITGPEVREVEELSPQKRVKTATGILVFPRMETQFVQEWP